MDKDDDLLRLDRQICFPLYAASNLLTRLYRRTLAELGLTYPQYLVMLVLWEQEPQSVGSLGERLYLDSGTLTPLLKRMESAGLITRERDSTDERRVLINLTDSGRALRIPAQRVPLTLINGFPLPEKSVNELQLHVRELLAALARHSGAKDD